MKASYRWLRELLPSLSASPKEVAERFTHAGLEVEGTIEYGAGTESCGGGAEPGSGLPA